MTAWVHEIRCSFFIFKLKNEWSFWYRIQRALKNHNKEAKIFIISS